MVAVLIIAICLSVIARDTRHGLRGDHRMLASASAAI